MPPSKGGSTRRRWAIAGGLLFGLYLVIGFAGVPVVVESQLVQLVEDQLGVQPRIEHVRFNPFDLRLSLEGVELPDPKGGAPAAAFEELVVDLDLLGFLSADVALDEVVLVGPRISAVVGEGGRLNWLDLLAARDQNADEEDKSANSEEGKEKDEEALIVDVDMIRIKGGRIHFEDRSQNPKFDVEIEPLDFEMEGFTTRPNGESPYSLVVQLGADTRLGWKGSIAMDPIRSEGHVALTGLDLRLPWKYASEQVRFEVESGDLEFAVDYQLDRAKGFSLTLTDGTMTVSQVELLDPANQTKVLSLPALGVTGINGFANTSGLASLGIEGVSLEGGRLKSWIEPDGRFRLVELFTPQDLVPPASETKAETTDAERPVKSERAGDSKGVDPVPAESGEKGAWPGIKIDRIAVKGFDLDLEDRSAASAVPIHFSSLDLVVEGYSTEPGTSLRVDLKSVFGETGQLSITGPLTLEPLATELSIKATEIGLADFQPYVADVARIDVTSGSLTSNLVVGAKARDGEGVAVTAKGRVQIDRLASLDRRLSVKFVEWESLRVEGLDYSPAAIKVEEVAIKGAQAHLVLDRSGKSNVDAIFGVAGDGTSKDSSGPSEPKTPSADASDSISIEVAKITLEGLGADFNDQSTDPVFAISVGDVTGTVEGLSSSRGSRARLNLSGLIDDVAPVRVSGKINPLSSDAYSDVKVKVSGVSLPAFSPYSGRYVGYQIDRGKLNLDLHYELEKRHLIASNSVALDQFDFGNRVVSDHATSLPVALAAVLLKNPKGNIKVSLPIEGDIDDPSFSLLGMLGKAVVNLVTRVATSPLSVVTGIVTRRGGNSSEVVFASGVSDLSDGSRATLDGLADLLGGRKTLAIEIRGRADPKVDGPGLRAARVEEELRRAAFRSSSRQARAQVADASAMQLTPEARVAGLEELYQAGMGTRLEDRVPRVAGESSKERRESLIKVATAALAEQVKLDNADWRGLARARGAAIQTAILEGGHVGKEQVFLVKIEVGEVGRDDVVAAELSLTRK